MCSVKAMGLEVAPQKTEVLFFYNRVMGRPFSIQMWVEEVCVPVGSQMKYLELTLDGLWGFNQHFAIVISRADRMAAAFGCLLPNVGGSNSKVRRLHERCAIGIPLRGTGVGRESSGKPVSLGDDPPLATPTRCEDHPVLLHGVVCGDHGSGGRHPGELIRQSLSAYEGPKPPRECPLGRGEN